MYKACVNFRETRLQARHSTPTRLVRRQAGVKINRNVISWLADSETLMFGYSTMADTDSSDDDLPPRFENVTIERPEMGEARQLAGFHDVDVQLKEKVIIGISAPHLHSNNATDHLGFRPHFTLVIHLICPVYWTYCCRSGHIDKHYVVTDTTGDSVVVDLVIITDFIV